MLNFWKFTSYCSLIPLWSYLTDPTSPIPSHYESIVVTSTLRVNIFCFYFRSRDTMTVGDADVDTWREFCRANDFQETRKHFSRVCEILRIQEGKGRHTYKLLKVGYIEKLNSYSASHDNWCTGTLLCYSNSQRSTYSISKWIFRILVL